jgi:aryl-alcohol dehydrogenase-like predicted oxidoreductase
MNTTELGKSNIFIPKIMMGTWQAGKQMWTGIEDNDSIEALKTAYENGITAFDTAEMYGKGHSEKILGQALKDVRKNIVIATKAAPFNLTKDKIKNACHKSLKNIGTDYIDLYQIHWPAGSFGSKKTPVEETLDALNELKNEGKIRAIGVSNFSADQLKEASDYTAIDSVQPPYSILWRHAEKDILPLCKKKQITMLSYSPMAQGLLTGKFQKDHKFEKGDNRRSNKLFSGEAFEKSLAIIKELKPVAADLDMSMANLALCWVISRDNTVAIAGARNAKQAENNAKALNCRLPEEVIKLIDSLSAGMAGLTGENPVMWD